METGNTCVASLPWCEVCQSYERNLQPKYFFSRMLIDGSGNHRTSNIINHATSSQHKALMECLKFNQAKKSQQLLVAVAPIVSCLMKLDTVVKDYAETLISISLWPRKVYCLRSMFHFMN